MAKVCVIGKSDIALRGELFGHEGSRQALSAYDITEPWVNTVAVNTVSLGAATALLNDIDWYLTRYARDAIIFDPSISDNEWVSRLLAEAIRDTSVLPHDTGDLLKVYGIEDEHLVEPMYIQRHGDDIPPYDLRPVDDTLLVRIARSEFGGN